MLLTFKTLDHKIFKYEVSEEDTVDDVKTRIEEDFGSENIYKLIYSGKIMKDDQQLKSYKINERQFVVLMITKPQSKTPNNRECLRSKGRDKAVVTRHIVAFLCF